MKTTEKLSKTQMKKVNNKEEFSKIEIKYYPEKCCLSKTKLSDYFVILVDVYCFICSKIIDKIMYNSVNKKLQIHKSSIVN